MMVSKATQWLKQLGVYIPELTFTPVESDGYSGWCDTFKEAPIEMGVKTTVYFYYKPINTPAYDHFQISIDIWFFEDWLSFYAQLQSCWLGEPEQFRSVVRFGNRLGRRMSKTFPLPGWPDAYSFANTIKNKLSGKLVNYNTVINTPFGQRPGWWTGKDRSAENPAL